jgi:hypothetical protein
MQQERTGEAKYMLEQYAGGLASQFLISSLRGFDSSPVFGVCISQEPGGFTFSSG